MITIEKQRPARDRILDAASSLFYAQGIRAVGVDAIIEAADVARGSFYNNFASKDDLVVAFLNRRDKAWRDWLQATVERLAPERLGRPLAIFDALHERFRTDDFRGCAFINSIAEMADRDHAIHRAADAHKRAVIIQVGQILAEAGFDAELARSFALLMDGAIVTAVREGVPDSALRAKLIAGALLASQSIKPN